MSVSSPPRCDRSDRPTERYSPLTPRVWHGMRLGCWLRLLARNRCAVSPSRIPRVASVTAFAGINSVLRVVQEVIHGRRASAVELAQPPLFVLGHWRSGTTLLHELLIRDPRLGYPTTYQCMAPNHFLISSGIFPPLLSAVTPQSRPMDAMQAGFDRPQEDEFALANLGLPSPYRRMAFPNRPLPAPYLSLEGLSAAELDRWRKGLMWFLQRVAYRDPRRLVLKSPAHTARVAILREMFPQARFVHIVRDPLELFPSTVRLWRSLNDIQGLQVPDESLLEEYVFSSMEQMYASFEAARADVPEEQLCDVRFEELVRDPLGQMETIYRRLDLGDFGPARPGIERYLEEVKDYRPNRNQLDEPTRRRVAERWGDYARRYGYALDETPAPTGTTATGTGS